MFNGFLTNILAPKDLNKEFFKQNFSFQSIRKMEVIIINFVTLGVTNQSEIPENNQFLAIFDPIRAKYDPNVLDIWHFQLYLP